MQGTTHQFHEPFGNGKAEPPTSVFVTTGEWGENRFQRFRRNSLSAVLYAKEKGRLAGNRNGDIPRFREFDRVACEIKQTLSRLSRVPDKRFRNIRGDVRFKGNAFLARLKGKQGADFPRFFGLCCWRHSDKIKLARVEGIAAAPKDFVCFGEGWDFT